MARAGPGMTSQWDQTIVDINHLVDDHKHEKLNDYYRGITKRHFRPSRTASQCANSACKNRAFTNLAWRYHCFRCGEVFCKQCVRHKLRLNNLAHPDPQGYEYSVCRACFEQAPQDPGQSRDLMSIYSQYRQHRHNKSLSASVIDARAKQASDTLDIDAECARLVQGFKDNMLKNSFSRLMHEVKTMCCTPDWQKHALYKSSGPTTTSSKKCCNCECALSLLKRYHECCVCGQTVCQDCSSSDLLLYVPDNQTDKTDPKITIIKIVGCPETEPDICLYLRVCVSCKTVLQKRQVNKFYDEKLSAALDEAWRGIAEVADTAIKAKLRIEAYLPHYQSLVESLEQELHVPKSGEQNRSNIQLLAKGQEDLSDYFTQLVVTIHGLKRMNPETKSQTTVLRNLTSAMCRVYHESMVKFRDLRSRLEEVTPLDMLRCIQELVEKNTINGGYLSIRQLAYESIHLCDKHKIDMTIPESIVGVEKVMYEELRERVVRANEDWDIHESILREMLQIQLKSHRFIRPSRQLSRSHGAEYVRSFLLERCDSVTQRILMQMSVKCADKSFPNSKRQLDQLNKFLAESYKQA